MRHDETCQVYGALTINYEYDPLYRLTSADYSTGDDYQYTYDEVGNRLTESNQLAVSSYQYTGLGDRIRQTVNGVATNYTLDLNAGLTQVLNDGTNAYVYGLGRIAQVNTTTEYFLGDALGSVRQMVNASGTITLAKGYTPYGEVMSTAGSGTSIYAYTGEQTDVSGLTYLRSRLYDPASGRFTTKDSWQGDYNRPLSLNRWNYGYGNPVNYTDPSGHFPEGASQILSRALFQYSGFLNNIISLTSLYDCSPLSGDDKVYGDGKVYDLTWWLALAMSRHGDDARVKEISQLVDYAKTDINMSNKVGFLQGAYLKFYNLEGPWKVWDVKRKIHEELKEAIILCGTTCGWFDYSTPGNIHFGFIAYRAQINQAIAAVAGGALEQLESAIQERRLHLEYCSQNASTLFCDNPGDQAAVDFGYMLAEKYKNIPTITEKMLRSELTSFWMSKFQRPTILPYLAVPVPDIRNDYAADHFNN